MIDMCQRFSGNLGWTSMKKTLEPRVCECGGQRNENAKKFIILVYSSKIESLVHDRHQAVMKAAS